MTDGGKGEYRIDLEDEVVRGAILLHEGTELPPPPKPEPSPVKAEAPKPKVEAKPEPVVEATPAPAEDKQAAFSPLTGFIGIALLAMGLFEFCLHTAC